MTDSNQTRHAAAAALLDRIQDHLAAESHHLDDMIDCSRELQRQLRRKPAQSADELPKLFRQIEERQRAIDQARQNVVAVLADLPGEPTTLSGFMSLLPDERTATVKQLRSEIFDKLDTVRSITLGNQMVLYYSFDFYQRMLRGLTGNDPQPAGYSPTGRRESIETGQVMFKNC